MQHAYRTLGYKGTCLGKFGSTHNSAKAVSQYTKDLVHINTFGSIADAVLSTGISQPCISNACAGRSKSAGGFIWLYS